MLKTEERNPATMQIATMTAEEMAAVMQEANMQAARAVGQVQGAIAEAIEGIYQRMKRGGRLFYAGCGTSGRIAVQDAAEIPVTYGMPYDRVIALIAGGDKAIRHAVENVEDDGEAGRNDLAAYEPTANDSVVGISAAGGAAYVLGAMAYAKEKGAFTVGITSNAGSKVDTAADVGIHPDTGAEVVTGSTRMKAGTAQKMI